MIGIAYIVAFCTLGIWTSSTMLTTQTWRVKIWVGLSAGLGFLMFLPFFFALFFGFKILAHIFALLCAISLALFLKKWMRKKTRATSLETKEKTSANVTNFLHLEKFSSDRVLLLALIFASVLFGVLFSSHILRPAADGSLHVGQSTFGDLNFHLGLITSIARQKDFPPDFSIFPGHSVNYPFLVNSLSSSLLFLGLSLRASILLPTILFSLCLVAGIFILALELTKSTRAALLSLILFFINGGFGFAYFMDGLSKNPNNFFRQFSAFYNTATNYNEHFIRWSNTICDMIIPQRTSMAGWAWVILVFWILCIADRDNKKSWFLAAGIGAGMLPMIHTHSFLALGVISLTWACIDFFKYNNKKEWVTNWLTFGIPALALALPQLFTWTFAQTTSSSFVHFHFNWANEGDIWPWFWVKNVGIVFILLLPAWLAAEKKDRRWYAGSIVLFIIADLIVFQPNRYDNNKLFYIWYLFSVILVSHYIVKLHQNLKNIKGAWLLTLGIIFCGTFSGLLTIGRELISDYQLFSSDDVQAAAWISKNTDPEDTFLTANNHNNFVSTLTGRNLVTGSAVFLHYHGFNIENRIQAVENMFAGNDFDTLAKEYSVEYVVYGPYERGQFNIYEEPAHFQQFDIVYQNPSITIYSIIPYLSR